MEKNSSLTNNIFIIDEKEKLNSDYSNNIEHLFEEFLEAVCAKLFDNFNYFEHIEYEIEDAYCRTNLLQISEQNSITRSKLEKILIEELTNRDWIIDYAFDNDVLEIYYYF